MPLGTPPKQRQQALVGKLRLCLSYMWRPQSFRATRSVIGCNRRARSDRGRGDNTAIASRLEAACAAEKMSGRRGFHTGEGAFPPV
jgi:hypothetical protein